MAEWQDIPEPVTWTIREPITFNGTQYASITLRAPRGEEILKVTSVPGRSLTETSLHIFAEISAEHAPFEVVKQLPEWMLRQMGEYLEEFVGVPAPDPLEAWRRARREREIEATRLLSSEGQPTP